MSSSSARSRFHVASQGTDFSVDFPMINDHFCGLHNKYAYGQVVDSVASSIRALPKYGSLEKFYLAEEADKISKMGKHTADMIKVEHHQFGGNQFCPRAAFVPRHGGPEEDDGWIVSFIHDEDTITSQRAIEEGADFIETDILASKDVSLICFHDAILDDTTDIVKHNQFAGRKRTYEVRGSNIIWWFVGWLEHGMVKRSAEPQFVKW